VGGGG